MLTLRRAGRLPDAGVTVIPAGPLTPAVNAVPAKLVINGTLPENIPDVPASTSVNVPVTPVVTSTGGSMVSWTATVTPFAPLPEMPTEPTYEPAARFDGLTLSVKVAGVVVEPGLTDSQLASLVAVA